MPKGTLKAESYVSINAELQRQRTSGEWYEILAHGLSNIPNYGASSYPESGCTDVASRPSPRSAPGSRCPLPAQHQQHQRPGASLLDVRLTTARDPHRGVGRRHDRPTLLRREEPVDPPRRPTLAPGGRVPHLAGADESPPWPTRALRSIVGSAHTVDPPPRATVGGEIGSEHGTQRSHRPGEARLVTVAAIELKGENPATASLLADVEQRLEHLVVVVVVLVVEPSQDLTLGGHQAIAPRRLAEHHHWSRAAL